MVDGHLIAALSEIICNVGSVQEVVCEVLLDNVLLVSGTDDEIIVAVVAIELHDVPEDGLAAQFNHGLGLELAFFTNSSAIASG